MCRHVCPPGWRCHQLHLGQHRNPTIYQILGPNGDYRVGCSAAEPVRGTMARLHPPVPAAGPTHHCAPLPRQRSRDLVERTSSAHITWHPWKRVSAAAYIGLGAPLWAYSSGPNGGCPPSPPLRTSPPSVNAPSHPVPTPHCQAHRIWATERTCGHPKPGHQSQPERSAQQPLLHTSSTTRTSTLTIHPELRGRVCGSRLVALPEP